MTVEVEVEADDEALAALIARRLSERVASLQRSGRVPSVVLTGGTIALAAYAALDVATADWAKVDFWWGDERFVLADDPDNNASGAREAFLDRVGADPARVHAMPSRDEASTASEAADRYAASLPTTAFDVVLLGVGPDGHVASLFPGYEQLTETERLAVEVIDSPKPPPTRVTLTYPALNNATAVWFLVSGEGKADAVRRAHTDATIQDTPAVGVRGRDETLWLLDQAAASALPSR